MKSILVPIEQADGTAATLETALLLARQFDSYVEGCALRPAPASFFDVDSGGSLLAESFVRQDAEAEQEARRLFESFMQEQGVARAGDAKNTLSYGWLENAPEGDYFVGSHGRVFDITVLGRPGGDRRGPRMGPLEAALFDSGHPVLLAPPSPTRQMGSNVLIAWNCSTEQARATAFAMPMLQRASRITVLTVEGGVGVPGPTGEQVCRHLQTHGIAANASTVGLAGRSTGEAILATARELGCDLLIKGAYTQSRLRQMIFGGATRHILTNATIPVLLAH
jgi:nucleotide-binding universal stress UspA family protein